MFHGISFSCLVKCSEEAAYRSASEQLLVNQPSEQDPSDAERMTTELRDIITEFMEKVNISGVFTSTFIYQCVISIVNYLTFFFF